MQIEDYNFFFFNAFFILKISRRLFFLPMHYCL